MKKITITVISICLAFHLSPSPASARGENEGRDNRYCLSCHALAEFALPEEGGIRIDPAFFRRSIHGMLYCVDCHDSIRDYPHRSVAPVACSRCHGEERSVEGGFHSLTLTRAVLMRGREGTTVRPIPGGEPSGSGIPSETCRECHDEVSIAGSVHEGRECADCHADIREIPHDTEIEDVVCGRCHLDEWGAYTETIHGRERSNGNEDVPTCASCHGRHDIRHVDDPASTVHPLRIHLTCLSCHGDTDLAERYGLTVAISLEEYSSSVHGESVPERGLSIAATCVDCHGGHEIAAMCDPSSRINFRNVPSTCGRCHEEEESEFERSVHGTALTEGIHDVPTCSTCHGEHGVLSSMDEDALTNSRNVTQEVCARCHAGRSLETRFGVSSSPVETYLDSYHGLAVEGGSSAAATCVDCHGAHLILDKGDTESSTNPANIVSTCGTCHEGADESFAARPIHHDTAGNRILSIVSYAYIALILLTIGGMLAHNLLILARRIRMKAIKEADTPVRFTVFERIQHLLLLTTFFTLVITGFALKYPEMTWTRTLSLLGLDEALRGLIHRIAGLTMAADALVHLIYLVSTKRGRGQLRAILPVPSDITDFIRMQAWNLGLTGEPPRVGWYDYAEKAEYWALVWGTIVMTLTGLILWFPDISASVITKLGVDIAELVHFFEAWLAFLAILVWHFFFVFLHPGEYPMNLSMILGRASRHLMHERGASPFGDGEE